MGRESLVNAWWLALARGYGAAMRLVKPKEDAELLELFEDSARNVQRAAGLLRELFADHPDQAERGTGLDAADVHALTGALDDIVDHAEEAADRIVRGAVASLFVNGIDPMIVIRWKDIFETLESAADACETVANVLEGITLKRGNGRH